MARRYLPVITKLLLLVGTCDAAKGQSSAVTGQPQPISQATTAQAGEAVKPTASVPALPSDPGKPSGNPVPAPIEDPVFLDMLTNEEAIPVLGPDDIPPEQVRPEPVTVEAVGLREVTVRRSADGSVEEENPEVVPDILLPGALRGGGVPLQPLRQRSINQAFSTGEAILGNLSGLQGALTSPFLPRTTRELPPLRLGVVHFRPYLSVGVVASHTTRDGDEAGGFFQAGFEASLHEHERLFGLFEYTIGYMPTGGGRGGSGGRGNGIDQHFSLDTRFSFPQWPKLQLGVNLDYAGLSSVNRDVGESVDRVLATGVFFANYEYSKKTDFEWDIEIPVRDFSDGVSSGGVTSSFFVNNQVTRKTRVGVGLAVGTLKVEGGTDQWFEQALLRTRYLPSPFLIVDGTAGLELRQIEGTSYLHPIFGLGITWKPRLGTSVELAAESRVFNSATERSTNYRSTSVALGVSQRIGYRLTGSLFLGYEYAVYDEGTGDDGGSRQDHLVEVSAGLSLPITQRWSCGLTLSAGENKSNVRSFSFLQGVLQTSYSF